LWSLLVMVAIASHCHKSLPVVNIANEDGRFPNHCCYLSQTTIATCKSLLITVDYYRRRKVAVGLCRQSL